MVVLAFAVMAVCCILQRWIQPTIQMPEFDNHCSDAILVGTNFVCPHVQRSLTASFQQTERLQMRKGIAPKARGGADDDDERERCKAACGASSSTCLAACTRSPKPLRGPCSLACGIAFAACVVSCGWNCFYMLPFLWYRRGCGCLWEWQVGSSCLLYDVSFSAASGQRQGWPAVVIFLQVSLIYSDRCCETGALTCFWKVQKIAH